MLKVWAISFSSCEEAPLINIKVLFFQFQILIENQLHVISCLFFIVEAAYFLIDYYMKVRFPSLYCVD
jgi:hypothetical protein